MIKNLKNLPAEVRNGFNCNGNYITSLKDLATKRGVTLWLQ
jgi:hypothetical protein